jgi:putative glutamine amidotransferase
MAGPLIGVTPSRNARADGGSGAGDLSVPEAYLQALIEAGACPVVLPLGIAAQSVLELADRLDGILFSGGGDVDPARYADESGAPVHGVDADRDRVEIELLEAAVQRGLPFLGICRGIQVINVALGGSLYADIPSQLPGALKHDCYPDWPRDHLAHEVQIERGSRLARILDTPRPAVNSLHHQAVRQLAPGLRPLGHSPDGLVEAIELPNHPFGVAVQWHPELLTAFAPMRSLFLAFVEAAAAKG